MKRLTRLFTVTLLVAAGQVMTTAWAADAEDIIKYRKSVMKSQAGHLGGIAQIVRGKVDNYSSDLSYHASALAASMKTLLSLFPKDSDFGDTRAKEAVWAKRGDFEKATQKAQQASSALLKVIQANDKANYKPKFKAVADSCKACHKDFRTEE